MSKKQTFLTSHKHVISQAHLLKRTTMQPLTNT